MFNEIIKKLGGTVTGNTLTIGDINVLYVPFSANKYYINGRACRWQYQVIEEVMKCTKS